LVVLFAVFDRLEEALRPKRLGYERALPLLFKDN
jgi:hypothetical protein